MPRVVRHEHSAWIVIEAWTDDGPIDLLRQSLYVAMPAAGQGEPWTVTEQCIACRRYRVRTLEPRECVILWPWPSRLVHSRRRRHRPKKREARPVQLSLPEAFLPVTA
jgi:hypothetical protein